MVLIILLRLDISFLYSLNFKNKKNLQVSLRLFKCVVKRPFINIELFFL